VFSFAKWCAWIEVESAALRAEGVGVEFKAFAEPSEQAGLVLESARAVAMLRFWGDHSNCGNGLADIDVLDVRTKQIAIVCTGTKITDDNFPAVYRLLIESFYIDRNERAR